MTILSVAEGLTKLHPYVIVFDAEVKPGMVIIDRAAGEVRIHPDADKTEAGGPAGWSNRA